MCYNMCIYILWVCIYIYLDIDRRIIFVYTHINMYIYMQIDTIDILNVTRLFVNRHPTRSMAKG